MKKILFSSGLIVFVAAVTLSATGAFFSDSETSTGNTFTAGSLDLRVDNECYYNKIADGQPNCPQVLDGEGAVLTSWTETDLGPSHRFFWFDDIKPGDFGEDTISLHVYDNDAWGRFLIRNVGSHDNTCTEPESEVGSLDPACDGQPNTDPGLNGEGELGETIDFYAWLDQGATPGFQGTTTISDSTEGDNIWQCVSPNETQLTISDYLAIATSSPNFIAEFGVNGRLSNCDEPLVILPGGVEGDEDHNIWEALAMADDIYCSEAVPVDGHNNYGLCHGIADDGRMVGSTTYYFGLAWNTDDVGNEAQTDSLVADLIFQVVQHRNNPSKAGFEI